jgi:glycerophosphoryl diester phosphodiesterase
MVAAHRGVATGAAENTIEAFTNAIAVGADMIEFDVRMTRDGELIAFHDARVNGVGVRSLTRDEIESATGVRPPLLSEVLGACAGRIKLDVELKEDGYVPAVMAVLKAALDPGEFVVTSFLPTAVDQAKTAFPEVKTGLLIGGSARWAGLPISARELYPIDLARKVRADYLAPHYRLAKFGTVSRAAAAGLPCLLWTVNADPDIRAFASDPRVAVIITDHAERALAIVAAETPGTVAAGAKQRSVQNP